MQPGAIHQRERGLPLSVHEREVGPSEQNRLDVCVIH